MDEGGRQKNLKILSCIPSTCRRLKSLRDFKSGERSDPPNGSGAKRSSIDTLCGKQPHDDEYAPLLKELQQNEARFAAGEALRPILVRNKDLLARALATLPMAGQ